MDTLLGNISLTETQKNNARIGDQPTPFKSLSFSGNNVIGVSETMPTEQQKSDALSWIISLPETPSQELAISLFDFKILWGTVWAQAITPTGLVELPPYAKTIEDIWNYPNRAGVYTYMQMLVAAGKGTTGDLAIIVAAFSAQGIDITTIT